MKQFAIIILLILLIGCEDHNVDNPSTDDPIFTFNVPDEGVFSRYSYWIVLRDNENGELIDSQEIRVGAPPTEFRTNKPMSDKLIVTYVRYDDPFDVRIWAYNDIPVGTRWSASYLFEGGGPAPDRSTETYDFVIENVPAVTTSGASDLFGWNVDASIRHTDGKLTGAFNFSEGGSQEMFYVDDGTTNSRYKFIDAPAPGTPVTFDYADMNEFDTYLEISFPEISDMELRVDAYNPEAYSPYSYQFYADIWSGYGIYTKSSAKLGFLDRFENYKTEMKFGNFNFASVGPAPTKVEFIDENNFTYDKTSPTSFSLTTSLEYTYARSLYLYSVQHEEGIYTSYQLAYHTTSASPKQFDLLTSELEERLRVENSRFKFTNLEVHFWKGRDYMEGISFGFDPEYDFAKPVEHSWVSVWEFN